MRTVLWSELSEQHWRLAAACAKVDPELFFPEDKTYDPAKAICATCPVIDSCRQFAIDAHINEGVYGGLSPRQRRPFMTRRISPCGTRRGYVRHREKGEEPCGECKAASRAYYRANDKARQARVQEAS